MCNFAGSFVDVVTSYHGDTGIEVGSRLRSWDHCYTVFYSARESSEPDVDYLSLHLAFYLASWGMYRGSSFLLERDYKIHFPVVEMILSNDYDSLVNMDCVQLRNQEVQDTLRALESDIRDYYSDVREAVTERRINTPVSSTLITKILLGTLGCVPAYDRYFSSAVRHFNISSGTYSINSLLNLVDFYESNREEFETLRSQFVLPGNIQYPQMKLLDMGFWKLGYTLP